MLGSIFFDGTTTVNVIVRMLTEYVAGSEQRLSLHDGHHAGRVCMYLQHSDRSPADWIRHS
jgi:hypothetical protein